MKVYEGLAFQCRDLPSASLPLFLFGTAGLPTFVVDKGGGFVPLCDGNLCLFLFFSFSPIEFLLMKPKIPEFLVSSVFAFSSSYKEMYPKLNTYINKDNKIKQASTCPCFLINLKYDNSIFKTWLPFSLDPVYQVRQTAGRHLHLSILVASDL